MKYKNNFSCAFSYMKQNSICQVVEKHLKHVFMSKMICFVFESYRRKVEAPKHRQKCCKKIFFPLTKKMYIRQLVLCFTASAMRKCQNFSQWRPRLCLFLTLLNSVLSIFFYIYTSSKRNKTAIPHSC